MNGHKKMDTLSFLLVFISLVTTNIYVANSYTLTASILSQLGYNNQSTSVVVENNSLDSIDLNAFNGYSNLNYVKFESTNIQTIDLAVLKDANKLDALTIVSKSLVKLSNSLNAKFPKLRHFTVYGSQLEPVDIGNVTNGLGNLTDVFFQFRLNSLKPNLFSALNKLTRLTLETPNMTSLNKAHFNGLTSLTYLRSQNNNIKTVDVHTFEDMTQLDFLDLTMNFITSFEYLQIPKNLKFLALLGNQMNYFALSRTMGYLNILDIRNNRFRSFRSMDFTFLANLSKLYLSNNPHAYPYEIKGHLKPLVNLQEVLIANLSISSLDSDYFKNNTYLWYIDLSQNNISSINNKTFVGLTYLKHIQLQDNKLTTIEPGSFAGLPTLYSIDLSGNQLTQLDSSIFAGCNKLQSIYLHNNPNLSTANGQSLCPPAATQCKVYYISYSQ